MANYGFEYWCGANVLVRVEGFPIMECAGISYEIQESRRPLYGYSSRHFDAMSSGQVIVQGTLLVNYVHEDYLYRAIQLGLARRRSPVTPRNNSKLANPGSTSQALREAGMKSVAEDFPDGPAFVDEMKDRYWSPGLDVQTSNTHYTDNPHDLRGGIELHISYGFQDDSYAAAGKTGKLLTGVHFLGRSSVINIDSEVIVEAYPFIARREFSLRPPYKLSELVIGDEDQDNRKAGSPTTPITLESND